MDGDVVALAARGALYVSLQIGGPMLIAMLAVGLVVSVMQAVTQVNEATLTFIPKVLALAAILIVSGPWMGAVLKAYTMGVFDGIVAAGVR